MPLLVRGLIDDATKTWNGEFILWCFNGEEAQAILSFPMSRWGCEDKLVCTILRMVATLFTLAMCLLFSYGNKVSYVGKMRENAFMTAIRRTFGRVSRGCRFGRSFVTIF